MSAAQPHRHVLSKSTFIRGCQCHKSLYLYKHSYRTRDPLSPAQRAIFARGTNVGVLARELFPGGQDASPPTPFQYAQSVRHTRELLDSGAHVIYEAAFTTEGVLAAMDILVREPVAERMAPSLREKLRSGPSAAVRLSGTPPVFRAYEVKSSTGVTDTYLLDAALQYWVIRGAGIELSDISIVHIDNAYVRRGELDIAELFRVESVLDEVLARQEFVERKIAELKDVIGAPGIPQIEIGPHCRAPYPCDFMGTCWREIPEYSVFDIARLPEERKFELYRRGIVEVRDVPTDLRLSEKQRLQVEAERNGEGRVDRSAIADFLDGIDHPLYFVDFESFQPAVPLYEGSSPYQQIPFQFSLHVLAAPRSELLHVEYLAEAGPDPRREFLEQLLSALGPSGSVLVYNRTFEETRLAELADAFPDHAHGVDGVRSRMVDLMVPFRDQVYYTPGMRGSYSIKQVLPALVPDLSYASLGIQDGTEASVAFEGLIGEVSSRRRARVRRQLLEYCKMDTYAMVRIYEALLDAAEVRPPADPSRG